MPLKLVSDITCAIIPIESAKREMKPTSGSESVTYYDGVKKYNIQLVDNFIESDKSKERTKATLMMNKVALTMFALYFNSCVCLIDDKKYITRLSGENIIDFFTDCFSKEFDGFTSGIARLAIDSFKAFIMHLYSFDYIDSMAKNKILAHLALNASHLLALGHQSNGKSPVDSRSKATERNLTQDYSYITRTRN